MFLKLVKMTQIAPKSMDYRPWFWSILTILEMLVFFLYFALKTLENTLNEIEVRFSENYSPNYMFLKLVKMTQIAPKGMVLIDFGPFWKSLFSSCIFL